MKALKIFAICVGILILGALTMLYLGAMKAPKSYIADFSKETEHISENKIIKSYPNESLERRSNLDARIAMSDDDSIGLRISLKEKAIFLELQGIVLSQIPIIDYQVSHFFTNLSPAEKYFIFRSPLTIQRDESTIEKNKFKEMIAQEGKEAQSAEALKATADSLSGDKNKKSKGPRVDPIIYRLFLDHGIKVQFTGQMPDSIPQYWPKFWFEFKERNQFLKDVMNSITKKTPVYYQPSIKLVIDAKDAETIYRAMPKNGMVILDL
ncbi:MAG: hypothetical protein PHY99_06625 [Bacteroidales bacterium]|nr:hypothetical protein [Bacteroidales bacterium]